MPFAKVRQFIITYRITAGLIAILAPIVLAWLIHEVDDIYGVYPRNSHRLFSVSIINLNIWDSRGHLFTAPLLRNKLTFFTGKPVRKDWFLMVLNPSKQCGKHCYIMLQKMKKIYRVLQNVHQGRIHQAVLSYSKQRAKLHKHILRLNVDKDSFLEVIEETGLNAKEVSQGGLFLIDPIGNIQSGYTKIPDWRKVANAFKNTLVNSLY